MNLLLFLTNNAILLFFAYALSFRPGDPPHLRILRVSVIYLFAILECVILGGIFIKRLNLPFLTLLSFVLLAVSFVVIKLKKMDLRSGLSLNDFKIGDVTDNKYITVIFWVVAATYVFKLVSGVLLVPYLYDSTWYHLPNLVDYLQEGRIFLSAKYIFSNAFPRNIEMLQLWQLLYFRNGVTLNLPICFITLAGGVATYGILREQNVRRESAFLGMLLFLSAPIILHQINTSYVDSCLGSLFVICLYFISRYSRDGRIADLCCLALALGILSGSKYTAVGYVGVFLAALTMIGAARKDTLAKIMLSLAVTTAMVILSGGVWYLLNYHYFGNPFYPTGVVVFGKRIFNGLPPEVVARLSANIPPTLVHANGIVRLLALWSGIGTAADTFSWVNVLKDTLTSRFTERTGGFGFQWIFLLVPSFLYLCFRKLKGEKISREEMAVIAIPLVSFLATPANWIVRYTCFIMIVGIYAFARLRDVLSVRRDPVVLLLPFVLLSCIHGSLFDALQFRQPVRNYLAGKAFKFRHTAYQVPNLSYAPLFEKIDRKDRRYTIVLLKPVLYCPYLYYYAGERTQNTVKVFPYRYWGQGTASSEDFERLQNENYYGLDTIMPYDEFQRILHDNAPDFVMLPPRYREYMQKFAREDVQFTLFKETDDGSLFYERSSGDDGAGNPADARGEGGRSQFVK